MKFKITHQFRAAGTYRYSEQEADTDSVITLYTYTL